MKMNVIASSDGELLRAFRATEDQDAFSGLMTRHGRMVFCAARSVIEDASAAEDIVQTAFLTLAQKGASLEGADSVAGWLCRVAVCLARDERRKRIRRAAREKEAVMLSDKPDEAPGLVESVAGAIYEELANLAEKYRQPVILHHLEGLSYEAAAPMCGCTEKAFSVRLTRGREQLRERLARRGVALGITALVAGLGQSASAAELPAGFVASTCAAAKGGAVSAQVTALMESALKMLFWAKVKTVAAVCAVALLVGGAGVGVAVTLPLVLHPAATTAPRNEPLSPEDAWIKELLARAEAGPWDVLDLRKGAIIGSRDGWRSDFRGSASGHRIWQTNANAGASAVVFDAARWKRGVVVGRVMTLPKGELSSELAVPEGAVGASWKKEAYNHFLTILNLRSGAYGVLYNGAVGIGAFTVRVYGLLDPDYQDRGVWYRFALYFDTQRAEGSAVMFARWQESSAAPAADNWSTYCGRSDPATGTSVGLGLVACDLPALWQGIKLVPLGPETPLPPTAMLRETHVSNE